MTKTLGQCWLKSTGNGRCKGEVGKWLWLVDGNWRLPVEVWVCNGHEALPFSTLLDYAEPAHEVKTSERLEITPLRKTP